MPFNIVVTWKIVGSAFAFLASAMGLAALLIWEFRKDYIEDLKNQVAVYHQADSWKLPETLKKLNEVSERLQSQLSADAEIKKLKIDIAASEVSQTKMAAELKEATATSKGLAESVGGLQQSLRKSLTEATQFTLKEGESHELAKNQIVFGLTALYSSRVSGLLNGDRVEIPLSGSLLIDANGETCTLRLIQASYATAAFSFACSSAIKRMPD